jgi:hypothetical protein
MISTIFIGDLETELQQKQSERQMIADQLAIVDVQIDKYDTIIQNMDKSILPFLSQINVAISSVKTAYDNRVAIGCKSDLYWKLISQSSQNSGTFPYSTYTYQCTKNPSVEIDYGYWGAKYYRRPQNQDYGANIVEDFIGSIGAASTNLAVVSIGATTLMAVGDIITDNIYSPQIFASANLPKIVSFATSSFQVSNVSIAGSITNGSTSLISLVGLGTTVATSGLTTVGIDTGSSVTLSGVIAYGTTVVGVGTTYAYKTVWNATSGSYISSAFSTNTLRLSLPAIGSTTSGSFTVGIISTFPSILLSTSSTNSASYSNFTVIRNTQSTVTTFDATNNPIDPVTIGIMNTSMAGYGHTLVRVNNTASTSGPAQWHEVYGTDIAPEPAVGAGYAAYYSGNTSWPVYRTINRTGVGTVTGYGTPTYATEGTILETGFETTFPVSGTYFLPSVGIDTATVSSQNPSAGTCTAADNAITAAETSRDAIIAQYQTQIDSTIDASKTLRRLRDKLETRAFSLLQARTYCDAEINTIKQNLVSIRNTDFTPYEPPTNLYSPAYRYSSSTVGFASTGT